MMKNIFEILILLLFMFVSEQALALRCGTKLIDIGDSKHKVAYVCGEPDFREIREIRYPSHCRERGYHYDDDHHQYNRRRYKQYNYNDYRYRSNYATCQYRTVDVWIYNFGPRKFMRELIFRKGIVKKINTLEYGY